MKNISVLSAAAIAMAPNGATAGDQQVDPPLATEITVGTGSNQCREIPPAVAGTMATMREKMITPGTSINVETVFASPEVRAARRFFDEQRATDWPYLCRYKSENEQVRRQGRPMVVFMGDSITENWRDGAPSLFSSEVLDRGISGQTSSQMLVRFYQDVISLRPRIAHIMAGTNDIAGNTGPTSDEDFKNNIRAMVDLARSNGIEVVLGSIPPTSHLAWQPSLRPAQRIRDLNGWLRAFASDRGLIYADYHSLLSDADGGLPSTLGNDGVHPNRDGYAVMLPVARKAISDAIQTGTHL